MAGRYMWHGSRYSIIGMLAGRIYAVGRQWQVAICDVDVGRYMRQVVNGRSLYVAWEQV